MQGYGQFCPVAKALEILGRRWTLLILRELLAGARRFSEVQRGVPLMSRTLLAQRLHELEVEGLIVTREREVGRGREYTLTEAGAATQALIEGLGAWGGQFVSGRITPEDCDPTLLFWAIRRHADRAALPAAPFVIRFEFRNLPHGRRSVTTWWLVWMDNNLDLCLENPSFEVDLVVNAAIDALVKVWMGALGLQQTMDAKTLALTGSDAARTVLIRMLDLRAEPCTKLFDYGPPPWATPPVSAALAGGPPAMEVSRPE